VARYIRSDIKF